MTALYSLLMEIYYTLPESYFAGNAKNPGELRFSESAYELPWSSQGRKSSYRNCCNERGIILLRILPKSLENPPGFFRVPGK
jgi:hypothetical protein